MLIRSRIFNKGLGEISIFFQDSSVLLKLETPKKLKKKLETPEKIVLRHTSFNIYHMRN